MYLNGIDFPNKIVDAIKEDQLVIFAGAGVSMGAPTLLPNFEKLVEMIAEDTGEKKKKQESCEVFLGRLKQKGIPVNQDTADIILSQGKKHNNLHEAIINLFTELQKIKIVTTNYDQMFEQVCGEKGFTPRIYNAPALPLGNDFDGIVHLHGNVCEPQYMVVTDEDFGKAYLTNEYASRFLVQLFSKYDVLFISYSYTDIILNYLTRAMPYSSERKRYILTSDRKNDWEALGIIPIYYPKNAYGQMGVGIKKLGDRINRSTLDWKHLFEQISTDPPLDPTVNAEIDYCLNHISLCRIMANCINGKKWLDYLEKKDIFKKIFLRKAQFEERDEIWMKWLIMNFVGQDDESLRLLIERNNNILSVLFSKQLLIQLQVNHEKISDENFQSYLLILDNDIVDDYDIIELMKILYDKQKYEMCFHVFKKLFHFAFILKKSYFSRDGNVINTHQFQVDYHVAYELWKKYRTDFLFRFSTEILFFSKEIFEDLFRGYSSFIHGVLYGEKITEPWELIGLDIERSNGIFNLSTEIVLSDMFFESMQKVEEENITFARSFLDFCLSSKSITILRIGLKSLRESNAYTAEEKLDILLTRRFLDSIFLKEQVYRITQAIFNDISPRRQDEIFDIYAAKYKNDDEELFNWCFWIQQVCKTNTRINEIVDQNSKYIPKKHPELIIYSESYMMEDKSPISADKMNQMSSYELLDYIYKFVENRFDEISRLGLLREFSQSITNKYDRIKEIIIIGINNGLIQDDTWDFLIDSVEKSSFSDSERIDLLQRLTSDIERIKKPYRIAAFLYNLVQRDTIKTNYLEYKEYLLLISKTIFDNRETVDACNNAIGEPVFNTTVGMILLCWVTLLSYESQNQFPDVYRKNFEMSLSLSSEEKNISIQVVAGNFNLFYYHDRKWTQTILLPMFIGNNKNQYLYAWKGVAFFSKWLNPELANVWAPVYLRAVSKMRLMDERTRRLFIDLYVLLLFNHVEAPTKKYIPDFYRSAQPIDIDHFVESIDKHIHDMDKDEKNMLWDKWLRRYLENRINNRPVKLTMEEKKALFILLPKLEDHFDEATKILLKGDFPSELSHLFWYQLDNGDFANKNPDSTALIIGKYLTAGEGPVYFTHHMLNILRNFCNNLDNTKWNKMYEKIISRNPDFVS